MLGGKSYYLAEAETLLKMLNGIQPDIPTLCVIDEIFRGTNSRERIAAASQYLKYIAGLNALTMAATHDIELTDIVKDKFDIYYFAEDVSKEGLVFDYRLRHGVSPTRNAIKILDYLGYPEEIVSNSNAMIAGEEFISSH
jgi:DNA mismatch repair ATPase MutS